MGKSARIRRRKELPHGEHGRSELAGMSSYASLIAVSEITGIPAEKFCNWALVAWTHHDGKHALSLISPCVTTGEAEWGKLALLLEKALGDARQHAKEAGQ